MSTTQPLPRDDSLPATLADFVVQFGTEDACTELLRRWKYGGIGAFRCPACGCGNAWHIASRRVDECQSCGRQTSLTSGTVFHRTRKPLRLWFLAMFLMTSSKRGISATELSRQLGVSYPTAWTWLHKLRSAMGCRSCTMLEGHVEVDESYKSGVVPGKQGRTAPYERVLVGAALEAVKDGKGIGRVRMRALQDASSGSLHPFVADVVAPGSEVSTDAWRGYSGLSQAADVTHRVVNIAKTGLHSHQVFPAIHRVFSLLGRFLMGTYHGRVERRHVQGYLAEFEFRFNRRRSGTRGLLFQRLLAAVVGGKPPTYAEILGGQPELA
jgi:transposase-like protein